MRRLLNNKKLNAIAVNQSAFALPTIILLTLIMSFVAYAALIQSNNNLNLAYKQSYLQIARTAAKGAIDYAQEEFDSSLCGDYDGTTEQDIITNDKYRVTIKAEVLDTSNDGYEKTIKGTGSVYLPKTSGDAKYVFDVRSQIVRTYALCKTPDNFDPLLWLDASDTSTLKKSASSTQTVTYSTDYGSLFDQTRDTVKERQDDGTQPVLAWYSRALDMHTCNSTEFISFLICFFSNTKYLYDGMVFQNVNVPKDSVIEAAKIEFTGCNASDGCPSGNVGGKVVHRTRGIYQTATDPDKDLFTSSGVGQIRNRLTNSSLHTTAYSDTETTNFPPGNTVAFNVKNVVQEMVNNPDYASGQNMGFGIERISGNGSRRADKDAIKLTITYSSSGATTQAQNNEQVTDWLDKSSNLNNAIHVHGNAPTRVDNQINGKPIVRFSGGDMLSILNQALSGQRDLSVGVVLKTYFSSSASDARVISGMNSTATNDTTSGKAIIPLLRYGNLSGYSGQYSGSSQSTRIDYNCGSQCSNTPYLVGVGFTSQNTTTVLETLKGNGQFVGIKNVTPITSNPPYTFSIDQIYIGGNRTGTMPGTGEHYINADIAEIIVFDHTITCREGEAIEDYLRNKWDIYPQPAETVCPEETIPTL